MTTRVADATDEGKLFMAQPEQLMNLEREYAVMSRGVGGATCQGSPRLSLLETFGNKRHERHERHGGGG